MSRNLNIGSRGPRRSIEERFWLKVTVSGVKVVHLGIPLTELPSGLDPEICWIWSGATSRLGYGSFWDGTYTDSGGARMTEAHRWAFKHFVQDPGSLDVLHHCDIRACVNFTTCLFSGTHAVNMKDRDAKGRGVMPPRAGWDRGYGMKLTGAQILEMRSRATGKRGEQRRLAEEYGICHQQVSAILSNKAWQV